MKDVTPVEGAVKLSTGIDAEILREALPYIRRFKGKTFVLKISGKVTEHLENLSSLAQEIDLARHRSAGSRPGPACRAGIRNRSAPGHPPEDESAGQGCDRRLQRA